MRNRSLWLLIACWLSPLVLCGQLQPTYTIKYDPGGFIFNEFRFSYEWKLTGYKYIYASTSYYSQEASIDNPIQVQEKASGFQELWRQFTRSDYNKFLFTSASYFYKDDKVARERLQGPVLRFGLRQYFLTKYAPKGPFLYLGLNYGFIYAQAYNEFNDRLQSVVVQKPGFSSAFGYQHLFGHKKNWAIEFFGGMEYMFLIEQGKGKIRDWQNLPNLVFYGGAAVGFAFRQRHRHW